MKSQVVVYIALGSNQGSKLVLLQQAIQAIYTHVGCVIKVSSVYQTQAMGFEGDHFLNACIAVKTRLLPYEVLNVLLDIELSMGRKRLSKGYHNRPIDLDILLYDNIIIEDKILQIPHPKMAERDFVIFPLADIAGDLVHPVYHNSITYLKNGLSHYNNISLSDYKLQTKKLPAPKYRYYSIEGNIGAGKTTLASMLAQDIGAKIILERFKDNAFLPDFYQNPDRFAFATEMSFLADRYQQLKDDFAQLDLFSKYIVADYNLNKSQIFAKITLPKKEFDLYKKVFDIINRNIVKPDKYVYLYQSTDRLLDNIKKRGRVYEQSIQYEYLEKINEGYLYFIKHQQDFEVMIVDVTSYDFVKNRKDYIEIVDKIF